MSRALLGLLLLTLALSACREEEAVAPKPVRPVLSLVAEPRIRASQGFTGVVSPRYTVDLGFRLLGSIIARDVDVGDSVTKGQRVAALDPVSEELAVRAARAELASASAQLETTTTTEARQRKLLEQKTVSESDYEAAQQAQEEAAASVGQAKASLRLAEEQLSYTQIIAEFDGVVTSVAAEVGQVVSAGQTVVTIARPDVREAVIDVPTEIAEELRIGDAFEVGLELDPSIRAKGTVREIAPQADPISRTKRVRITLIDPPVSFRLGTTVNAVLGAEPLPGIELPVTALLEKEGRTMVWIVDEKAMTVAPVEIKVADRNDRTFRVLEGITPGTRVVVAGVHSLEDGQAVRLTDGGTL